MNDLFIQGLTIDWNRVRPYNYVRQIPAISGIDTFTFHKPIKIGRASCRERV